MSAKSRTARSRRPADSTAMKNIRSFAIVDYVKAKRYASLDELMRKFGV